MLKTTCHQGSSNMKKRNLFSLMALCVGLTLILTSCEQSTDPGLIESFQVVNQVTPITTVPIESMNIGSRNDQDSYLTVALNHGVSREGWCIEWNSEQSFGIKNGARLYSTKDQDRWKKLNYFMNVKNDFLAEDPDLTYREIQVAIWSIIDNPTFNVDKISTYRHIPRIWENGEILFNVQKVKNILQQFDEYFADITEQSAINVPGVTFIENDGQTIMIPSETAYAYNERLAKCFDEEIIKNVSFHKWGWTNGLIQESDNGDLTFDIYSGAGRCDRNKGSLVGKLIANYSGGTLRVTYRLTQKSPLTGFNYTLGETHLFVGNEPYPKNGKKYTVAPGKYGFKQYHNNATEYTYTINNLKNDIYIIAHADVTGFNPN